MSKAKNTKTVAKETEIEDQKSDHQEQIDDSVSDTKTEVTSDVEVDQEQADADVSPELIAAQEEIAKLKDAYLRAKAEEDNVRRRSEKEVANSRKFAVEGFAKEMLNVADSLKLACSVEVDDDSGEAVKSLHEGVEITLKQLNSAFAKFALVEIAPEIGDKVDPNLHQAMSMIESEDVDSGCVINIIQSGYKLHDRLLRPAMVVVAK